MSYEVTATRRRPQQFDNLVGQEFVAETLKNSIKSGKIAHAYLFAGPRGCGKTTSARILAKALNCQNGPTDTPCGHCSNCEEITKGSSLDVIEIDGASNTSVENIRQIKDEVLFPPTNSKYKIYIIDEVHMLSTSAFNALLKTIEEPPEYVIFIFATTELQKVPATIKSRCQQYNFRLIAIDKIKQCLAEAAAELNIQADDEALYWIARESTGSMRDAYTLFDQVVAFSDGHITYEKIRDKLGLVGIDRLNTIFEACAQNKTDEVINLLDEFLQCGVSIEQLISNCADYLRSLLLIKNNIKKESLLGNAPERYSSVVLNSWNTVQIERALSIFFQLYRDIRYSLSPRYEMELTFSRLCWIGQYVSNTEVKKAIDAAQALLKGAPVAPASPASAPVSSAPQQYNSAPQADFQRQPSGGVEAAFDGNNNSQNSQGSQEHHIPNGLPRLSMLDTMTDDPGQDNGSPESSGDGGDPNPFHNGGPLPPEQSVENGAPVNGEPVQQQKQPLDKRLIINIPESNIINGDVVPTVEVPASDIGYTVNPDEPDDGWSNIDEPPEEPYYPDESELQYEAEQIEQKIEDENKGIFNHNIGNESQGNQSLRDASGNQLTIGELRDQVIKELTVQDSFAASTLDKTGPWIIKPNSIDTKVSNAYDLELIKRKIPIIAESISKICGKKLYFNVAFEDFHEEENKEQTEIPPQVNMIIDAFKGTLVAGKI